MTIYIHHNETELDAPFDSYELEESILLAEIQSLPAEEFWTIHRLFDGELIKGEDIEKLMGEIESAVCLGLPAENELQKLAAYCDNAESIMIEVTEESRS